MDHAASRLEPARGSLAYLPLRHLSNALRDLATDVEGPVVDLGSGGMPYRELFPCHYVGLDLQHLHGAPDAVARAEECPLRSSSVGTVLTTQQLEHVDDPRAVLLEAWRVLRPGGTLIISTHGVWAHHPDPRDLWRWTEEGLVELIASCGFEVKEVRNLGGFVAAGLLLAAYPLVGLGAARSGWRRIVSRVAAWSINALIAPIDAATERRAPRHYASVGYVVAAVKSTVGS